MDIRGWTGVYAFRKATHLGVISSFIGHLHRFAWRLCLDLAFMRVL